MTVIEDQYNWNKLAERGSGYEEVRTKLSALEVNWYGLQKEQVFTEENEFTKRFKQEVKTKVDGIFESSALPQKDIASMKRKFHARVQKNLELAVLKKGLAQITFDQYPLYKFFEAFNTFVDEVEFNVSRDQIKVVISDPSRIAVIKVAFSNDSFLFLREGTVSVNIGDLKEMLRCQSKSESTVTLLFAEEGLEMSITSEKRKRTIVRKLNAIDFEPQEMPLDTLNAIKYPFEFEMTKDDYLDLLGNSGRYSEILGIKTTLENVIFSEASDKGSAEIEYKKDDLPNLTFLEDVLDLESEIKEVQLVDKEIFDAKRCKGYYSLPFLRLIKEFCAVLNSKDAIKFSLKTSHPLKAQITFKKLTNATIVYFLAPRMDEVDEDDFEDEEDLEPTETEYMIENDFESFDSKEE
ncbi:MAG: hypothetical protein EAX91_16240 [Candidatus Lokiarchaeota archaeon]|nr:hypothetical protein [Candidatus Lokiarchaeota archaeon]